MLPKIENRHGWKTNNLGRVKVYYWGHIDLTLIKELVKILKKNIHNLSNKILKNQIAKFKGNFSIVIVINKNISLALVDRIKSTPIFISKIGNNYQLGNYAPSLKENLGNSLINTKSLLSFRMAGYCIGRSTLYKNIVQLLPGEFCLIKNNKLKFVSYYSFIKKVNQFNSSESILKKKLTNLTLSIISDLLSQNKGKKIIVPLSGGYDSRLIVSGLFKLNAKNVICYSYGKKNNFEAKIAKKISNSFGYPWHFIELSNKIQAHNFNSELYKRYTCFADTLSSWAYVQDFFAVQKLIEKKIIDNNSTIVNGNTGDFISGGHLPKINTKVSKKTMLNFVLEYVIKKHFSLWENYFDISQCRQLKKTLLKSLPDYLFNFNKTDIYKVYEYIEFVNRQSNYVIQGQRVYDFFNINWALPLWHDSYLDFWNKVPYELKVNQYLYKSMLIENNWGNVWKNLPINKHYISPISVRYFRNILKILFLFTKRTEWQLFDKKYISYFTELNPHYSYFNYLDVIKDKRIARSSVAWHVEDYLKNKGLVT